MNCKLGGELWGVDIPLKQLMVVGMDVSHGKGTRSVIGFVASINQVLTRWYSHVVFQLPQQEIADSLRLCLANALQHFHEVGAEPGLSGPAASERAAPAAFGLRLGAPRQARPYLAAPGIALHREVPRAPLACHPALSRCPVLPARGAAGPLPALFIPHVPHTVTLGADPSAAGAHSASIHPSVHPSICPSIHPSIRPSVHPSHQLRAQPRAAPSMEQHEGKGGGCPLGAAHRILWHSSGGDVPPAAAPPGRASSLPPPELCPPGPGPQPTAPPGPPQAASRQAPSAKPAPKGTAVPVGLNLVQIHCQNDAVYQYHVTFSPEVECRSMRFAMLKEQRAVTGDVTAFDGSILFLPILLPQSVSLKARRRTDGEEITIVIQITKVLEPSSDLCIPFYNVLFRRAMRILDMKQVGRNFYDLSQANVLHQHRLQIWPGYSVSIRKKDGGLFLMVDTVHRIIRSESVLECMHAICKQSPGGFHDECTKQLVGSTVLTRYNNRTYRVDDIDWDKTPRDSFTLASGEELSFVDYYSKTYGITVQELDQPLLIHRPKEKPVPGGRPRLDMILLVPELTFLTGISEIKKDNRVLKDVRREMLQSPQQHYESLCGLLRRIQCSQEASHELARWGLVLSPDIHRTQGRILPSERVNLRHGSFFPAEDASWNKEVVREAAISTVSARPGRLAAREQRGFVGDLGWVLSALAPCCPVPVCTRSRVLAAVLPFIYSGFASWLASLEGCVDEVSASPPPPGPQELGVAFGPPYDLGPP
ncbi:piwi-like protein 2 [Numida meleagris]|uniref:piwi-like protein 2 n=1 Tax=Numida meleagris TaxID=8996 RepID=UPI000B3E1B8D|nr:piwi-like protein 2 [Numida meleagris]